MKESLDLSGWYDSLLAGAADAVAAAPAIKPAHPKPVLSPSNRLLERRWDPGATAGLLRDLSARSCVMLRNFISAEEAGRLAEVGRRCFAETDENLARTARGEPQIPSIYSKLRDAETGLRLGNDRSMRSYGGMLIETVPRAGYELFRLLRGSGLLPLVEGYIGGRPLVSGHKCSLRLGDKDAPVRHVFHQDGAFLGGETARTMNIWIALTEAGIDAPGLELFPDRTPEILPVGEEGSTVSWEMNEDRTYARFGRENMVVPSFQPGDALIFDQMCVHRTHVRPEMTKLRLAYECWFFPPDPAYQTLRLLAI
ncbi:MAG: phytanoyl-CoA dioxygenase family protein [Elsteraceae bacterium]